MVDTLTSLLSFIPSDRRLALAQGQPLPDRATGAALVADVSGFTPLTEALAVALGPQRGAEELTRHLDTVYGALIGEVERFGGSVVSFSGDAVTCWFDQDTGLRATAAALAMQTAMQALPALAVGVGPSVRPSLKVAVAAGAVRRYVVGDPTLYRQDILAGRLLTTLGALQAGAERGTVVLAAATADALAADLVLGATRATDAAGPPAVVVSGLSHDVAPRPWPALAVGRLTESELRPWVPPAIYERLRRGSGQFLAQLRPAVALFISFSGIDNDDDDDAGLLLDAYVRSVQGTLARYEAALLNLTIGDKGSYLHGVVGVPVAHDDDAGRAIAAALALRQPPAHLNYISQVRVGVAQGQMYAGAYGCADRRTFGVQGDKTNLAARLMEHAQPGEILCDDDVYRQARRRWVFEALAAVRVKGKAGLIRVYRPTGRPAAPGGPELGQGAEPPLVGRHAELAQVDASLTALQAGQGGVLTIAGEAGIGKSRLVEDLARRARERGLSGLIGTGQSIEQHTAYRAWRDILTSFFDLDEVADPAERRARVQQVSQELVPKLAARLPLLNDILALGLPETPLTAALDAALRHESLTGLVVALLRQWTRERPLIVVLEDAHWLDPLSWQLTGQVARALLLEHGPLLLVLVSRGLDDQSPGGAVVGALSGLGPLTALTLGTLEPDAIVALVTERLGLPADCLPEPVAALVRDRAGGNPFFAEELAYTLRDRGLIRLEPLGPDAPDTLHCVVTPALAQVHALLPDTLQGLILARIDRLPAEQQFTLKIAAVIGRRFALPPLRDTLLHFEALPSEGLPAHLAALTQHDLTTLEAAEPELTYLFKHIVIHEVAYETLLFAQRRQIHQVVADWYAAQWEAAPAAPGQSAEVKAGPAATFLPLLVYHCHHAEAWTQERRYAHLAGEQAARKHANAEAIQYLTRALELTPAADIEAGFEVLLAREAVYELQGAREQQAHDLDQLRAWSEALDPGRQATVARRQANLAYQTGDYPAAVTSAQRAVGLAAASGLEAEQAQGSLLWGMALWQQANYAEAQARNGDALDIARRAGLAQVEADGLRQRGIIFDSQADYPAARAALEAALDMHRAAGDQRGEAKSLNSLGVVAYNQEDYAAAGAYYARSLQLKQDLGDRYGQGITLQNLGIVAADQGDLLPAQRYFQEALATCREIDDREGEASALDGLGTTALRLGDFAPALTAIEQALAISRQIGERVNESSGLANLSTVRHWQGDHAAALAHSQAALAIAQAIGARFYEAGAWLQVGQAQLGLGEAASAAEAYQQALTIYGEMGKPRFSVEPLAGLARAALARGAPAEGRAPVEAILGLLGAEAPTANGNSVLTYLTCYQVLQATGDPRAAAVLQQAHALLQARAARIADEAARARFLTAIPSHRELLRAWQAAGQSERYFAGSDPA